MKAVVAAFNQEKALVGALSVIVQLHRLIVTSSSALGVTDTGYDEGCKIGDIIAVLCSQHCVSWTLGKWLHITVSS